MSTSVVLIGLRWISTIPSRELCSWSTEVMKTHMSKVTVETGDHWMLTKQGDTTGKSESDSKLCLRGWEGEAGGVEQDSVLQKLCMLQKGQCFFGRYHSSTGSCSHWAIAMHSTFYPLAVRQHWDDGIDVNCVRGSRASQSKHWAHHYTSNDNNNTGKRPLHIVLYELKCLENTERLHSVGVPSKLHSYTSKDTSGPHVMCTVHLSWRW